MEANDTGGKMRNENEEARPRANKISQSDEMSTPGKQNEAEQMRQEKELRRKKAARQKVGGSKREITRYRNEKIGRYGSGEEKQEKLGKQEQTNKGI